MITACIIVCDKDVKYLDELLKKVENLKLPHKTLVISNCSEYIDKADYNFYENKTQFSARLKALDLCDTEYIWFIDADDSIYDIETFDYSEDMVVFGTQYEKNKKWVFKNNVYYDAEAWDYEFLHEINNALWNKIIKTDLLRNVYKYIEDKEYKIISKEDEIFVLTALKHAKSVRTVDKILYFKKEGLSDSRNQSFEKLKLLMTGSKDAVEIENKIGLFTNELKQLHDTYLMWIVSCIDIKEWPETLEFAYEYIENKDFFTKYLLDITDSKEKYDLLKNSGYIKYFPKRIVVETYIDENGEEKTKETEIVEEKIWT